VVVVAAALLGIIVDRSPIMFAGSPGYKVIFMFKPSMPSDHGRESIRVWTIKNLDME